MGFQPDAAPFDRRLSPAAGKAVRWHVGVQLTRSTSYHICFLVGYKHEVRRIRVKAVRREIERIARREH